MGFEVRSIDYDRLFFAVVGSQADQHLGKDTFVTPSLPTIIERLVRSIFPRCIPPP